MQRRQVLAGLGVLLSAGCLGAKQPTTSAGVRIEGGSSFESTPEPTSEPTPEQTPEPTPEPTSEPTPEQTPEPTPTEDIEAGDEAIDRVQSELVTAVEAYTGTEDGALADISLENTGFDVRPVLLALDDVQRELAAAEVAAVTDDQRESISQLQVAERFLTLSALAQSYFLETVDRLDEARVAFSQGVDAFERAENRFDTALDEGSQRLTTLKNDVDAAAVAFADPFDANTHGTTVATFDSSRALLRTVSKGLDRLVQGHDELADGREEEDDGNDDEAYERADEARDLFDEAYEFFDEATTQTESDSLETLLSAFIDITNESYLDAQDLYEDVS